MFEYIVLHRMFTYDQEKSSDTVIKRILLLLTIFLLKLLQKAFFKS